MQIAVTAGSYPSEISWEVYDSDGGILASGSGAGNVAFCVAKPSSMPTSTPQPSLSLSPTPLPHPYDQLEERVSEAKNGDVIDLDDLLYGGEEGVISLDGRDPFIISNISLTLRSSKKATLDGRGGNGRILTVGYLGSLTIDGLVFLSGTVEDHATEYDDEIGSGTGQGGCVAAMFATSLDIVNTDFRNCTGKWGGGLYVKGTDLVTTVDRSTFEHMRVASSGGGIYSVWGYVRVTNTLFRDNQALWGAVLYGDDSTWFLGGNSYEDNLQGAGTTVWPKEPAQLYAPQRVDHDGSDCGKGTYGVCSQLDTVMSCEIGVCSECAVGKANELYGATSEAACVSCPEGNYSNILAADACEGPCQAGYFVTGEADGASDGFGVTVGGTHCVACPAGRITSAAGSSSCEACEVSER